MRGLSVACLKRTAADRAHVPIHIGHIGAADDHTIDAGRKRRKAQGRIRPNPAASGPAPSSYRKPPAIFVVRKIPAESASPGPASQRALGDRAETRALRTLYTGNACWSHRLTDACRLRNPPDSPAKASRRVTRIGRDANLSGAATFVQRTRDGASLQDFERARMQVHDVDHIGRS